MGLRHGAGKVYRHLEDEERDALEALEKAVGKEVLALAADRARYDPEHSIELIGEASQLIRDAIEAIYKMREIRHEQLTPLIQKAAPPLEKKMAEMERRIERLEMSERLSLWRDVDE